MDCSQEMRASDSQRVFFSIKVLNHVELNHITSIVTANGTKISLQDVSFGYQCYLTKGIAYKTNGDT